ncbi:hypothetical protein OPV22_022799 [Ensete ventricosum]|uniref:Uncharacterized protein n=1 Tax=Ensete ventricosum TaxID=4639 RepID=A0AAV8QRJ4_ENSVE|nr:hypothetical protein OPV22_022799 [Ensete ventricosum]
MGMIYYQLLKVGPISAENYGGNLSKIENLVLGINTSEAVMVGENTITLSFSKLGFFLQSCWLGGNVYPEMFSYHQDNFLLLQMADFFHLLMLRSQPFFDGGEGAVDDKVVAADEPGLIAPQVDGGMLYVLRPQHRALELLAIPPMSSSICFPSVLMNSQANAVA